MGSKPLSTVLHLTLFIIPVVIFLVSIPKVSCSSGGPSGFRSARRSSIDEPLDFDKIASPSANLLFQKKILSTIFAIGWPVEVEYLLFNTGDELALDVYVSDEDFTSKDSKFNITQGQGEFRIGAIKPGTNVTLNMTAVPSPSMELGPFQFKSAKVAYRSLGSDEQVDDEIIGWSSLTPFHGGDVVILAKEEADHLHLYKVLELLVLIFLCIPSVAVPFVMWKSHTWKYDKLQRLSESIRKSKTKKGSCQAAMI